MRPAVFSITYLYPRFVGSATPQPAADVEPLEPIVPGKWAAWARGAEAEAQLDRAQHLPSAAHRSFRRPAFHTTRS